MEALTLPLGGKEGVWVDRPMTWSWGASLQLESKRWAARNTTVAPAGEMNHTRETGSDGRRTMFA